MIYYLYSEYKYDMLLVYPILLGSIIRYYEVVQLQAVCANHHLLRIVPQSI